MLSIRGAVIPRVGLFTLFVSLAPVGTDVPSWLASSISPLAFPRRRNPDLLASARGLLAAKSIGPGLSLALASSWQRRGKLLGFTVSGDGTGCFHAPLGSQSFADLGPPARFIFGWGRLRCQTCSGELS